MWLKLGTSQPKVLADELIKISKAKQAEEKAKMRELAKSEAKLLLHTLGKKVAP